MRAVCVRVTQVLDIFSQVSEEEDVVLADLAGDLNLEGALVDGLENKNKRQKGPAV